MKKSHSELEKTFYIVVSFRRAQICCRKKDAQLKIQTLVIYQIKEHIFCFRKFKFSSICGMVGDFVLVSNADSFDPDTEEGCDIAEILQLYESGKFL